MNAEGVGGGAVRPVVSDDLNCLHAGFCSGCGDKALLPCVACG
jgi:hypothetical protein